MNRYYAFLLFMLLPVIEGYALEASDDASAYGSSWSNGSNFGTGFGAWDLSDNNNNGSTIYAGSIIEDSTAGAGDINTGTNQSFGLYANPGTAYMNATRSFSSSLATNDRFTAKLAFNFDNGNKGFVLRSGTDEVVGFNLGNTTEINTDFTDSSTTANYDYGGDDAVIDVLIDVINATSLSYQISRTSSQGIQGVLFSGTVSGITAAIDNVKFYISDTNGNGGAKDNLYFNSLNVTNVPEPAQSVLALAAVALIFVGIVRRRRTS